MADPIDFAAILGMARRHDARMGHQFDAADILAVKVPGECPESGSHDGHNPPVLGCDQCPTIGQMLAEWEPLTALAEYARYISHMGACRTRSLGPCTCGLDAARAALEAVRRG